MTCAGHCDGGHYKGKPLPRTYPLEHVCCALAYLHTCETEAQRTFTFQLIAAQIGREHAMDVWKAWKQ